MTQPFPAAPPYPAPAECHALLNDKGTPVARPVRKAMGLTHLPETARLP
jgi:hypothetical protein